uniref:Uncharacterized protein LOC114347235 n=1 Tax=Diabrotica virgifera virgifera TaxID=50390 RepID=A0A6P7H5E5_DIAVI
MLNALGFCATYKDIQLFDASVLEHPQENKNDGTFLQYVYDNADHNINTIDGRNTFHSMGGIEIASPLTLVQSKDNVKKLKIIPSSFTIGQFGHVDIKYFKKPANTGWQSVFIENLSDVYPIEMNVTLSHEDFLWICGRKNHPDYFIGWHGFMEQITEHLNYSRSKINFLPFVNAPPSNYDIIYTVLLDAQLRCKAQDQLHTFVTFDQPLYYKSREILECCNELSTVIPRLGGFHTLMSFIGAIGFKMEGSGLQEAFCELYAENSTEKILNGHSYARAIRGHILSHSALSQLLLSSFIIQKKDVDMIEDILESEEEMTNYFQSDNFQTLYSQFLEHVEHLRSNGPTAKLWMQYYDMVNITKQFINAERSGNWDMHLKCLRRMLPYFNASGHYLYAKSSQIYLQDMYNLEKKIDPIEYNKFTKESFFTVRRSKKFWCGVWTDMCIEQILMRSMKTKGGLTHGSGISDSVLSKWILTMPTSVTISDLIQSFCKVSFASSEQHIDARASRIKRDTEDLKKLINFFSKWDPFAQSEVLASLTNGIVGDESINCHKALSIGMQIMSKNIGTSIADLKFQRKDRVVTLKQATASKKVNDKSVIIDPTLIFQRMTVAMHDKQGDLYDYLKYELAPYPLSIFKDGTFRKSDKSKLYDSFQVLKEIPSTENGLNIIDGGFLLHKVVWPRNQTFEVILKAYVEYVSKNYATSSYIIFDGYPENCDRSTKMAEKRRRQARKICPDVELQLSKLCTVNQEKLLSNERNKNLFISFLKEILEQAGFHTKQAYEDADTLIVQTAIDVASDLKPAIIISEDIDVLVILTVRASTKKNIYFLKPSKGKKTETIYSSDSFYNHDPIQTPIKASLNSLIGFIHAFSGCDTTSSFYHQGKKNNKSFIRK